MTAPTHAVMALAATVAYARLAGIQPNAPALLLVLLGCLTPDIDGDGSVTRPGTVLRRFLPRAAARTLNDLAAVIQSIAHSLARHRGLFHWPLWPVLMIGAALYLGRPWLFWFGWGYLWHILADFCTAGGVPILAPYSQRSYHCTSIRTGSAAEALIAAGLLAASCVLGWPLLPEATQQGLRDLYGLITR